MRGLTPREVQSKPCLIWRQKMTSRVLAMRRGRHTTVRWKPKRGRSLPHEQNPPSKGISAKMPLLVVANSPNRDAALSGLENWKNRHPEIAGLLAVDDVLVDSMRSRSSTWTRVRVNLRHVPEALRPPGRISGSKRYATREQLTKQVLPSKTIEQVSPDSAAARKNLHQLLRGYYFELSISAVTRRFIHAPSSKLLPVCRNREPCICS